jgi:hypothetical protein
MSCLYWSVEFVWQWFSRPHWALQVLILWLLQFLKNKILQIATWVTEVRRVYKPQRFSCRRTLFRIIYKTSIRAVWMEVHAIIALRATWYASWFFYFMRRLCLIRCKIRYRMPEKEADYQGVTECTYHAIIRVWWNVLITSLKEVWWNVLITPLSGWDGMYLSRHYRGVMECTYHVIIGVWRNVLITSLKEVCEITLRGMFISP